MAKRKFDPVLPHPEEIMFVGSLHQMPKAFRQQQEALRSLRGLVGRNLKPGEADAKGNRVSEETTGQ